MLGTRDSIAESSLKHIAAEEERTGEVWVRRDACLDLRASRSKREMRRSKGCARLSLLLFLTGSSSCSLLPYPTLLWDERLTSIALAGPRTGIAGALFRLTGIGAVRGGASSGLERAAGLNEEESRLTLLSPSPRRSNGLELLWTRLPLPPFPIRLCSLEDRRDVVSAQVSRILTAEIGTHTQVCLARAAAAATPRTWRRAQPAGGRVQETRLSVSANRALREKCERRLYLKHVALREKCRSPQRTQILPAVRLIDREALEDATAPLAPPLEPPLELPLVPSFPARGEGSSRKISRINSA